MTDHGALFEWAVDRPLLVARFCRPQAMLSWAMRRPGFVTADTVAWLEVSRGELTEDADPHALLDQALGRAGLGDAVAMMTARDVSSAIAADAVSGGVRARCLATAGLNNATRADGSATPASSAPGTINLLVATSVPLSQAALVEAMSIAVEARTAAVVGLGWPTTTGVATGTGTDCAVVAAPDGAGEADFAGLHTDIGCAIAAATFRAVDEAARGWIAKRGAATAGALARGEGS